VARLAFLLGMCFLAAQPQAYAGTSPTDSLYRVARAILAKPKPSEADLYRLHGAIAQMKLVQVDTALVWALGLQSRAARVGATRQHVAGLYHEAMLHLLRNRYYISRDRYEKGMALAASINHDSLRAQGLAGVGSVLVLMSEVDSALMYQNRALRLRERINDLEGQASSLTNLGRLYYNMQRIPEAERYLNRGMAILERTGIKDRRAYLNILHTKANIAGQAGRITEALRLDSIGLAICRADGNVVQSTMFLDNMANCNVVLEKWEQAEAYFYQCLAIDSATGNYKDMGDTWLNLGGVSEMRGRSEEAVARYRTALRYAQRATDPEGARKIYMQLAPLYRKLGQTDSALAAMQNAYVLRDSVLGERTRAKLDEFSALYENEQKERHIAEQAYQLSRRNYMLAGAGGLLLLAALGGWGMYRRQRLRDRLRTQKALAEQREEATRAIIVAEEEERSRLGRELHDGVGQIISAAKLHLTGLEDSHGDETVRRRIHTAIELVDGAATEIRALAHGMAPEPLLGAGLARATADMLRKMQTGAVRMEFHADELPPLPTDTTVVLYRILQEAAQNAVRHGQAQHISVSISRDAGHVTLLVEDDGLGFEPAQTSEGIGLANMRRRAEYLNGSLEVASAPGQGTTVAVHVPV